MTNKTATLNRTWLVQRLTRTWKNPGALGADNPFAFGGGYKNGGLSDDAMSLLRPCFGFDYMGSAEYEFGAVPEALQKLAKTADSGDLDAWEITIDLTTIHPGWRRNDKPGEGEATVYVLGNRHLQQEITERIEWIATEHGENKHPEWGIERDIVQFKEAASLGAKLLRRNEYLDRLEGWLELDNGFAFFVDQQMWARTAGIFGVQTGVEIEEES